MKMIFRQCLIVLGLAVLFRRASAKTESSCYGAEKWKLPTLSVVSLLKEPLPTRAPLSRLQSSTLAGLELALASEFTARTAVRLDVDPTVVVVATNLAVFAAWQLAKEPQNHHLRKLMKGYFLLRSVDLKMENGKSVLG